ncbi:MAG: hypothetical protein LCH53_13135 [Bacteroidetes bacterium]|nr:hypothetical protein [Bacteroidota bacterium]
MSTRPEQIDTAPKRRRKWERFVKKMTARLHRRWAKQDPEGAPRKPFYKGYTT